MVGVLIRWWRIKFSIPINTHQQQGTIKRNIFRILDANSRDYIIWFLKSFYQVRIPQSPPATRWSLCAHLKFFLTALNCAWPAIKSHSKLFIDWDGTWSVASKFPQVLRKISNFSSFFALQHDIFVIVHDMNSFFTILMFMYNCTFSHNQIWWTPYVWYYM